MKQIQPVDVAMASPAVASPVKDDFESNLDLELEKLDGCPLDQEEFQSNLSSREKSPEGNGVSGNSNQDHLEDSPNTNNDFDNNGNTDEESTGIQDGSKLESGSKTINMGEADDHDEGDEEDDEDDVDEEDDDEDQDVDSLLKEVSELVDSDSDSKDETRNTEARPPPNVEEEENEAAMLLLEDSQSPQPAMDLDEATTSQLLEEEDDEMTSDFIAAEADLGETSDLTSLNTTEVLNSEETTKNKPSNSEFDKSAVVELGGKSKDGSAVVDTPIHAEKESSPETRSKPTTETQSIETSPNAVGTLKDIAKVSPHLESQSISNPIVRDSSIPATNEESLETTPTEHESSSKDPPYLSSEYCATKLDEDCIELSDADKPDRSSESKPHKVAEISTTGSKLLEEKVVLHSEDSEIKESSDPVKNGQNDTHVAVADEISKTIDNGKIEPMDVSPIVEETADLATNKKPSTLTKEDKDDSRTKKDRDVSSPTSNQPQAQTKDESDGKASNGITFLDDALDALHGIAQSNRKLLDDESPTKRPRALDSELDETIVPAKKVKIGESDEPSTHQNGDDETSAKAARKLQKVVKRMSRPEIEDLVTEIMVEVLSGRSEIGKLRQKCDSYDENLELWKRKATALQKQCQDLNTVMRKYITDVKNRPQDKFTPIKITRSVGLQVVGDRKRLSINGAPTSVINMSPLKQMGTTKKTHQSTSSVMPRVTNNLAIAPGVSNPKVPMRYPLPQATGGSNILTLRKVPMIGSSNPGPKSKTAIGTAVAPKSLLHPVSSQPNKVVVSSQVTPTTVSQAPIPQRPPTSAPKASNDVIDVVDLSDEDEKPSPQAPVNKPLRVVPFNRLQNPQASRPTSQNGTSMNSRPLGNQPPSLFSLNGHPAPLPALPLSQHKLQTQTGAKAIPPKPSLKISKLKSGIVLSWNVDLVPTIHADITFYQIFAYQEGNAAPSSSLWKKVGDVRALPLPMACTLTQFQKGHKYHFAVRALDAHQRLGTFSDPQSIQLS
ncbi:hypothetical protein TCAL_07468 [Tigriopus californicus]|uniref:Fibronectin type-III domain-containing protein n=1 Tax=Tigriopus californicus TaxID=6832 RepID=A0A553NS34_TIGCA|nr:activating transcription factor 7-interacting protein 1-like [Tigriopus californicus]TRY68243.1 hypothetical protein TCAL_07468 [Tigriopus californicus]|eukprot:TCALIF_07468-PA protein Name:"Similar to Atf7ip Activating transcription factor 7-interacting protein 1 (Mus musculus)" AED:0.00 eAED:0.00 QI:161/1/1/1/0.8/0.66/6/278/1007